MNYIYLIQLNSVLFDLDLDLRVTGDVVSFLLPQFILQVFCMGDRGATDAFHNLLKTSAASQRV